jgi:hypothetical protein
VSARQPAVAPVLVSSETSLAILGLSKKRFLRLVRRLKLPHAKIDRCCIVARLDVVLDALGLSDAPAAPPSAAKPLHGVTEDEAIRRALEAHPRRDALASLGGLGAAKPPASRVARPELAGCRPPKRRPLEEPSAPLAPLRSRDANVPAAGGAGGRDG